MRAGQTRKSSAFIIVLLECEEFFFLFLFIAGAILDERNRIERKSHFNNVNLKWPQQQVPYVTHIKTHYTYESLRMHRRNGLPPLKKLSLDQSCNIDSSFVVSRPVFSRVESVRIDGWMDQRALSLSSSTF